MFVIGGTLGDGGGGAFDIHVHLFCGGSHPLRFVRRVLASMPRFTTGTPKLLADAEFWGKVHCALTFVGLNLTFMPT